MKTFHALILPLLSLLLVRSASAAVAAVTSVPLAFSRSHIHIPVKVNGSGPFTLVLDTGMPAPGIMLYNNDRVAALGLKTGASDQIKGGGTGSAITAQVAPGQSITIGDVSIADVPVTLVPGMGGLLKDADGVIGLALFSRYAVRVDVDNKTLDLFDKNSYQPPAGATVIPLHMEHDVFPFIDASVSLAGAAKQRVYIAVDLGASHALWLNQRKPGRLDPPRGAIRTTLGRGLSGKIEGSLGRVAKFEMGDVSFENVLALFPDAAYQNPGGFDFKDGFIGADLLTRFVVTIDYTSKRMVLVRGQRFNDPFDYEMHGMVFANSDMDRRSIDGVLPGSPAEAAGIQPGDVLVDVEGKPMAAYKADELHKLFQRDGATVHVTLERGGSSIEKTLTLRRLV